MRMRGWRGAEDALSRGNIRGGLHSPMRPMRRAETRCCGCVGALKCVLAARSLVLDIESR